MQIKKAFKFRMYPTPEQATMIRKSAGACRWVYNYALAKMDTAYKNDGTKININEISKELPLLKKAEETSFLKEVPSISLIAALRNLDAAYKNFFRRLKQKNGDAGFPKFKSKRDRNQSFQFHQGYVIDIENSTFSAPKIPDIKTIYHRPVVGQPKTCTISITPSGQYYISILCEVEQPDPVLPKKKKEVSIHLGLKNFAYIDYGNGNLETVPHPKYLIKHMQSLVVLQKKLSRLIELNKGKTKGEGEFKGSNQEKARIRVAKKHQSIANMRADFLHNLSAKIVRSTGATTIKVENWDIKQMMQDNTYLNKYISDSGWRTFWQMMEYKAQWGNIEYIKVDKALPSSKQCSECGTINNLLKKQVTWTCSFCGSTHNREQNAVANISMAAAAN